MTSDHASDIVIRRLDQPNPLLVAAINNASLPEDAWVTEEEVRIGDGLARPDEPPLRLVAWHGEQAVAFGYAARNIFTADDRYRLGIQVIPEFRRRGIAKAMYSELAAHSLTRGTKALRSEIHEHDLAVAGAWLERLGYREVERMRPSRLDLDSMDSEQWTFAIERVIHQGLRLTTLADEDSEANRRKLWVLNESSRQDVPHHGPSNPLPFEQFNALLGKPEARLGCLVIAVDGDRYVGHTLLVHQNKEKALTGMTGVDREYRNRGIALALKVYCAERARKAGYKRMVTFNHVNNPAMLAVNDRLGYVPLPHEILFEKVLDETGLEERGPDPDLG